MPPRPSSRVARAARATLTLAVCAGCAPITSGARPEGAVTGIEVSVEERFYEVEGMTSWDLNRALRENGPRDDTDGGDWFGATDFTLRYRYEPIPWADGCRAAEAHVQVELVTTLPEWPDREAAPALLRADWDLFMSRLREHERGHQRIAIQVGQEMLRGVEALRAADCETLRTEARRLAQAFQSAGEVEHASWDQQTDHGLVAAGDGG